MTSHLAPNLAVYVVAGGVAGNLTATGIKVGDKLISVVNLTDSTDITSEFTITADDTINNTGGGTTATDTLLVLAWTSNARGGALTRT